MAENTTRSMMQTHYGDEKMDKSKELNSSMSISPSSRDQYTKKIHNIKGSEE